MARKIWMALALVVVMVLGLFGVLWAMDQVGWISHKVSWSFETMRMFGTLLVFLLVVGGLITSVCACRLDEGVCDGS